MTTELPAANPQVDQSDLRRVLDEELDRLPDKYRLPILLCELEGMTLNEAARHLGWPLGTVATRLSRGREILRSRLSGRRGLVLPMVMTDWPSMEATTVDVPESLVSTTITSVGHPEGPAAILATTHGASLVFDARVRRAWFLVAVFVAVALVVSAAVAKSRADGAVPLDAPDMGSCHRAPP